MAKLLSEAAWKMVNMIYVVSIKVFNIWDFIKYKIDIGLKMIL